MASQYLHPRTTKEKKEKLSQLKQLKKLDSCLQDHLKFQKQKPQQLKDQSPFSIQYLPTKCSVF